MKQIGTCFWKNASCTDGLLTYGYASWKNDSSRACHHRSQACHHLPFTCKQVACYGSHLLSMKRYAIFLLPSVQAGIDVRRWVRTHCVFTMCIHRLMQEPIQPNGGDPIETGHYTYINFSKQRIGGRNQQVGEFRNLCLWWKPGRCAKVCTLPGSYPCYFLTKYGMNVMQGNDARLRAFFGELRNSRWKYVQPSIFHCFGGGATLKNL